ncbi:nucleotide exchange factor GrpE [archaeon 13_1_20CM_2_54_9]|nr:MAG: nucleotide exchange factor GrpE [Crenarchaeota archaeon 13_1_40CM_3_53_5]OLE74977.1 MAG: nucleotide exchange factor GrpE [archaeon 13_1_20CM_2_54_9]TMI31262.1 MAG: nucleotide exchange factor GrpE [Candidatus Bathyarchaeota archaeon]
MIVPEESKPDLAPRPEVKPAKSPKHDARRDEKPDPRLAELESGLNAEKAKADDYLRRLQYLQADFENYRKRVEKEVGDSRRFGNERLLSELLVVNDELELALQRSKEAEQDSVLIEGVDMVHKRLQGLLSKEGVKKIESVGSKFTPDLHEAALAIESDQEEGTVIEEIRIGYLLNGKVLRPSIVKVAEKHATGESRANEGESE